MYIIGYTHTKELGKKITPRDIWLYTWLNILQRKIENNTRDIYYYIHDWIYYKEKGMKNSKKEEEIILLMKKLEREIFMMVKLK